MNDLAAAMIEYAKFQLMAYRTREVQGEGLWLVVVVAEIFSRNISTGQYLICMCIVHFNSQ